MKRHSEFWCQTLAGIFAFSMLFGPVVQSAHGAATDISDTPMAVKTQAKPNIMFMLDNSGSMSNIVPDAPYVATASYFDCPTGIGIDLAPGSAAQIRITGTGTPYFRYNGTDYDWGITAGTGPTGRNMRCFRNASTYAGALYADGGTDPQIYGGSYLDSDYTGHYLNWFFGSSPTNWGSSARRKPGTQQRIEVARTAAKAVVDSLDRVRAGLFTYNNGNGGRLLDVMGDMDAAKKTSIKAKIDALAPSGNTPLAETLADIGKYFVTGYTGNLTLHPGPSPITRTVAQAFPHTYSNGSGVSSPDAPIQYWCQKSFSVLLTDGRPQGDQNENTNIGADLQDYDGDCSGANAGNCTTHDRKLSRVYESAGSDYLDDVAQALAEIDLRPNLTAPSGQSKKNNVSTYTIGFADEQVRNDPLMQETATQGSGLFLTAGNEAELVRAFQIAAQDILAKDGSAAAVAVANAFVSSGDNASYASSYNSGNWTGDLIAYPINLTTGVPDITAPIWNTGCASPAALVDPENPAKGVRGCSAQVKLDSRTPDSRFIVTYSGDGGTGQGVQFQPHNATPADGTTTLSSTQQALLDSPAAPGPGDGAAVVAYLRGERSGETSNSYRSRAHVLADIVNAEPVIVRAPQLSYGDTGYATFKTDKASRTKMVFQAANDGMLHAFNADTGTEVWAYVPSLVLGSLNALTRRTGFQHRYYVDGTPTVGDVDFSNTSGASGDPDWHTMLVGGLAKGGRGYYALDVTDPVPATEAAAASKVLWEFPNNDTRGEEANAITSKTVEQVVGYSFGKPIIIKTRAAGWVVLVTSGYNNGTDTGGDGQGYLFVLNARTGELIRALATGAGDATTPSGLAQITAFVLDASINNRVEQVYGGDLLGNVWRFDLSGATADSWNVTKVAILVDGSSVAQPITVKPELTSLVINGVEKRLVYVGTGKYLGDSDVSTTQTQTMYALSDDLSITGTSTPVINPLRSNLVAQVLTLNQAGDQRTFETPATVNLNVSKGWYVDMPATRERINTNPVLVRGALVFTSNIPSDDACTPGGSSWFNVFDFQTGATFTSATQGSVPSRKIADALASRPVAIRLPSGDYKFLIRRSDAVTEPGALDMQPTPRQVRRVSWKELIDE